MEIARVVQHFQPRFGYADYYLAVTFKKLGHDVCIITTDHYSPEVKYFDNSIHNKVNPGIYVEDGIIVYRLPTLIKAGKLFISLYTKKVLNDFKPDVVHSNDLFYLTTLLAAHYKNIFKYKLFVDSITGTFNPSKLTLVQFNLYKLLFAKYLREKVNGFFAISEGSKKWLSRNFLIPISSIYFVPLGADDEMFVPDTNMRKLMREKLGILDDDVVIIYTGKILPEKDIDVLIKSIRVLPPDLVKKIKILIVGNGPTYYLKYLNKLIKIINIDKKIIMIPPVNRNELPKYYNAADIAVWPGAPSISIIEAMSTGLPIIIAGYSKPREDAYDTIHLLANGNGLSFQRRSVLELASCIRKLASDEDLRKKMGQRSRKLVEEKLSWRRIAEQYLKIYEQS
jgi:glycosyltransferase involved in cell wall biosynthesis